MFPSDWSEAVSLGFAPTFPISAATFAWSTGTGVGAPDAVVAELVGVPEAAGTGASFPAQYTPRTTATSSGNIAHTRRVRHGQRSAGTGDTETALVRCVSSAGRG